MILLITKIKIRYVFILKQRKFIPHSYNIFLMCFRNKTTTFIILIIKFYNFLFSFW